MLFNSHIFIFVFLPLTLAGFLVLTAAKRMQLARAWLLLASLVFYGWWSVPYLGLLVVTIIANHLMGKAIARALHGPRPQLAGHLMAFGVAANIAMLAWFKYSAFVIGNVGALTGQAWTIEAVVLPLAISFHTFQQIAFLVDVRRGQVPTGGLLDYLLFVTFFPQLIAGPIVHHRELIPQFQLPPGWRLESADVAAGIAFFVIGLFKKLAIADPVGALATPTFTSGGMPGMQEAWLAVSAFTIGLYFDFSGYSDMAVGLARMFGIRLPYNFASPYQAQSIIEFWRRWHMTLSRFLRDYVYVPLGGNRLGPRRRYLNLVLTMLLGGIWHGAGWTFLVWGLLHGMYLLVNHAWVEAARRAVAAGWRLTLPGPIAWGLTLLAVMVGWTLFASPDFTTAMSVLSGLFGLNGIGPRPPVVGQLVDVLLGRHAVTLEGETGFGPMIALFASLIALGAGWAIVLFAPNSQEIVDGVGRRHNAVTRGLRFRPSVAAAMLAAAAFLFALTLMADVKEFVYFQF
ncbi:MBOAT family O-acyltransferase [Falsiroseomonas sp. E2-1-a20]|uniref:MBOAT family O-acyltransferase n=1 Tax=Falsiroseomonas sp. E2-1-a20 TaxID=3239300 RepID=UPI003F37E007